MADIAAPAGSRASPSSRLVLAVAAGAFVLGGLVFVLAPRLEWTLGAIYIGIFVSTLVIHLACMVRWNPELIERRMFPGQGTKAWDIVWLVVNMPIWIAIFAVVVLEPQNRVAAVPGGAWLLGLVLYVPAWTLINWCVATNPFFEKTVRVQTDNGHHVIDSGPYTYVRHPGYLGFAGWLLSTPLLLGSASAFAPALLAVVGLVVRAALEDRMLHAELAGYADYAARVRFRLIPGVW